MSDQGTDAGLEGEEGADGNSLVGLRNAAKLGQAAIERNKTLERQLLFARAGINVEDEGVGEMLFQTWTGGDDLEALKSKAQKVGALKAPTGTPTTDPARSTEDQQRQNAYEGLGGGEATGGTEDLGPHPMDAALHSFQENRKNGMPEQDAQHAAISGVIGAAMRGDQRVFFDQEAHNAKAAEIRASRGY